MARAPSSIVSRSPLDQIILDLKEKLSLVNQTIQNAETQKLGIEREISILEKSNKGKT